MSERTQDEAPEGAAEAAPAPGEPEIVDAEVVEEPAAETVEEAELEDAEPDPLTDALRERDEYLALAQRARADFENFKRRTAGQSAESERRGKAAVAKGMLPALDNLERALLAAGVETEVKVGATGEQMSQEVSAHGALASGVALVLNELRVALERAGVNSYDPLGERFDPLLHEAISTAPAEGVEAGVVLETLERGYRVDEQVIRPARVVVAG